jgi:hypothetical protein
MPDHKLFAKMSLHPCTKLIVEIRYVPPQAAGRRLDANGVKRSRFSTGIKG